jgi:serine protease Do
MQIFFLLVCAVALFSGCASNPFTQFYQSYTNGMPATVQQRLLPSVSQPQVISAVPQNHERESRRLVERGFICIGFSGFVGGAPTQKQLVEHAKNVGADIVIHCSEYSYTEQGVRPIFKYQPGQTYTTTQYGTANANVYGGGISTYGSTTYSGASTTTTQGTSTTEYVPYRRQVYQYGASYWRRMRPGIFGASFLPIPEDLRSSLQRNTGVFIDLVMDDSPAFRANIMRGDIVIQLAEKPISTVQEFIELLPSYAGQKVFVKIIRGDQPIDLEIQLGHGL